MNGPQEKPAFARSVLSVAIAGALAAAAIPVSAQTTPKDEAVGLEEVVVTARFKEEKLQETPIAITAVTADEIQSRSMQNAYEVAYTVPNASLRPTQAAFGASMSAYIRGVGQYDFLPEFEPGVDPRPAAVAAAPSRLRTPTPVRPDMSKVRVVTDSRRSVACRAT